jgi:hypothetical protein
MLYYHQQFPVLDVDIEPISTLNACPLLFWCIVVTASRNLPLQQDLFRDLCKLLPSLLSELMIQRTTSVHSIQALLILSMWPLPVQRQSEDMRWIHSGIAMQMALQAGLHQVGYEHEYRAFTGFRNHNDEQKHTRIWRCWCFVNAMYGQIPIFLSIRLLNENSLSCELGLPCLVPFDALELKPTDEAALPAEFSSRLRIALYISRINDALGHSVLKENGHEMRMIRLFEKDLNSLVIELRHSPTQWNDRVEFVYLGVILNLYSFYLRHSSSKSPDQPEYSIMKSSASRCASKAVQIYANSSFSLAEEPSLGSCWQRYCPKFYFGVALSAVFMLLKISALNELPTPELEDINNTIKLGHNTLISCSCTKGDEYQRAARVIEILCKRGVLDSAQGKYPVESRLGASLSYELLVAAVRWRKQGGDQIHHNPNNLASGGVTTATSDTRSIIADPTSSLINPYDWSNRFDFTQADLGLGSDSNWWGGQIFEVDILSFIRLLIHLWKVLIREKTMEPHIFDFSFAMQDCAGAIPEPSDIELV